MNFHQSRLRWFLTKNIKSKTESVRIERILLLNNYHYSMFAFFEMYAGYLKHLTMMKSAINYLWKINGLKNVQQGKLIDMLQKIEEIQKDVLRLQNCVQKVSPYVTPWHNSLNLLNLPFLKS